TKYVSIDITRLREVDTFGAWLLERLMRQWTSTGRETDIVGMPEHDRALLEEMQAVTRAPPAPPKHENKIVSFLAGVGLAGAEFGRGLIVFAEMLAAIGMATPRGPPHPCVF